MISSRPRRGVGRELARVLAAPGGVGRPKADIALDPAILRELSRLRPWVSTFQIFFDYATSFLAAALAEAFSGPVSYAAAVVWIGSRQHSILMLLHEGVHRRLFRGRALNEAVSELLLAWPLFITFRGFQREHLAHHRLLLTPGDPEMIMKAHWEDYRFPKSRPRLAWSLLSHALGLKAPREYWSMMILGQYSTHVSWRRNALRAAYYAAVSAALWASGSWPYALFYWLVPIATYLPFALYFRLAGEHFGLREGALLETRTIYAPFWERALICPVNINYHLDHHLFPSVPYYALPKLHRALLESSSEYRDKAQLTRGYCGGLLRELSVRRSLIRTSVSKLDGGWP